MGQCTFSDILMFTKICLSLTNSASGTLTFGNKDRLGKIVVLKEKKWTILFDYLDYNLIKWNFLKCPNILVWQDDKTIKSKCKIVPYANKSYKSNLLKNRTVTTIHLTSQ